MAEVGKRGFAWKMDIHLRTAGHHVLCMLDLFCISFSSLPIPNPGAHVSVHAEEPCGLWPSLGTSRKIKSGLQEGIKQPHTTFGLLLGVVSVG